MAALRISEMYTISPTAAVAQSDKAFALHAEVGIRIPAATDLSR